MVLVADIEEFRNGVSGTVVVGGLGEVVDVYNGEATGIPVGKWFDQDILNDAEDDRGCADTQCEREDCQQSESAVLLYAAHRKAKVLPE